MSKRYLATRYQQRFWLEWKLDPSSLAYNTALLYQLQGELHYEALKRALDSFVNEYDPGCRSAFYEEKNQLYQLIYPRVTVEIERDTLEDCPKPFIKEYTQKFIRRIQEHRFNLEKAPLFKFGLLRQTNNQYLLILNFHHIISDAQSARSFIQYLSQLYNHYAYHTALSAPISQDFEVYRAIESQQANDVSKKNSNVTYWQNLLKGKNLYTNLPIKNTVYSSNPLGRSVYFTLDSELSHTLKNFVRKQKTTLFIALSAFFSILLSRYTNQENIVLSYPVDSRPRGFKNLIGCFVNNFPLLVEIDDGISFIQLLQQLTALRKHSKQYQHCTLTDIIQVLRQDTLFQSEKFLNASIVEAYFDAEPLVLHGINVTPLKLTDIYMEGDLALAYQFAEFLTCRINYRTCLFDEAFITNMIMNFQQIIAECIRCPDLPITQLGWVHGEQKSKIASFSSSSESLSTAEQTVLELFSKAARDFPDDIAVTSSAGDITYKFLDKKSTLLAQYIRSSYKKKSGQFLPKDAIIGLYMQRCNEMIVAILAILKAGAAYLPLDISSPGSRLAAITQDSKPCILVTETHLLGRLESAININSDELILIDDFIDSDSYSEEPLPQPIKNGLAYVIYTSGSTGNPKGVMVEHGSLLNTITYFQQNLPITRYAVMVGLTSITFDIFGLELFGALTAGCRFILIDEKLKDDSFKLKQFLDVIKPTIMQGTPAVWSLLAAAGWQGCKENLTIICGGEPLTPKITEYLLSISQNLIQVYGPTETTIWSTFKKIQHPQDLNCIGKPISNTQVYVLDKNFKIVPVGVRGELYIGGQGVARGYLNQPRLTEEQFVTLKELGLSNDSYFYRTGDQVYWDNDGQLYFVGRIDFQVKLRGYRIELTEIEFFLSRHPGVLTAAVVVYGEGEQKYLVAYIEYAKNQQLSTFDIKQYLSEYLPAYMVPEVIIKLEKFLLSSSGKIDRKLLPLPSKDNYSERDKIISPRNDMERWLVNIWQEVLKRSDVGIYDNFFQLGGHSLAATQVIARICHHGKTVPIKALFKYPSIAAMARYLNEGEKGDVLPYPANPLNNIKPNYQLSPAQQRLWFINEYEGGNNRYYNLFTAQYLTGPLDYSGLRLALNKIIERHDGLRTIFLATSAGPRQLITEYEYFDLPIEIVAREKLKDILLRECKCHFDLLTGPLYRFKLLKINEQEHILCVLFHHIIIDGWSLRHIAQEISEYYAAYVEQGAANILPSSRQYLDFSSWQLQMLQSPKVQSLADYWQNHLRDYTELQLPLDYPRPPIFTYQGAHYYFDLDLTTYQKLKGLAAEGKTTLFATLLTVYAILLYRYSGQQDIIIGVPVANRVQQEFETVVGLLANLLPLRIQLGKNATFSNLLQEVTQLIAEAYTYQEFPFEKLVELLKVNRDTSRNPVVQVLLVLQNMSTSHQLNLVNLKTQTIEVEEGVAKFDLALTIHEKLGTLRCCLEYAVDLFKQATIQRMATHFTSILQAVIGNPQLEVGEIPLMSAQERHALLQPPLQTYSAHTQQQTLVEAFSNSVRTYPNKIAVSFDNTHLTYLMLNEKANQIANALRDRYFRQYACPLPADTLIGLYVERSLDLVIGILGILKAGGAYVPLDPHYPDDRLSYMVEDSNVKLILAQKNLLNSPRFLEKFNDGKIIRLDKPEEWNNYSCDDPPLTSMGHHLAYVIYTSGSTGLPKGVLLNHFNVIRLFKVCDKLFEFSDNDAWTLFHSYAFDFSVWEIWGALLHGARLVIVPYSISRNPVEFYRLVCREHVTILNQTPSAFAQFIKADEKNLARALALKYVIFGGEALSVSLLEPWWRKYSDDCPQLINMYGITETTVHVTYRRLSKKDLTTAYCQDIGKPLPDLSTHVLDENLNPVPVGVAGELYVGGAGLSRGYLNKEKLTAAAFTENLFDTRLYKTGDRVRWLRNGNLEYLGRLDNQVKIKGFRIELGEVEAAMMQCPSIYKAIVIAENGDAKRLIAYYLSKERLSEASIYQMLKQKLPDYMIPAIYIRLENFPLTVNGKVDYKKLPAPYLMNNSNKTDNSLSPIEKILAKIWSDVLQVATPDIHANFFAVGGDSIRTIQVVEAARKQGLNFTPKDIFQYPTIAKLASLVTLNQQTNPIGLFPLTKAFTLLNPVDKTSLPTDIEDAYPLAALQEGMIFYSEFDDQASSYIDVIGCFANGLFDEAKLLAAVRETVKAHPILRACFNLNSYSQFLQLIHHKIDIPYKLTDLRKVTADPEVALSAWLEQERKTRFILTQAPLWRINLHWLDDKRFHFSFTCHHAILDGWSVAKLLTEILTNYDLALKNKDLRFCSPNSTYRDFIAYEQKISNDVAQRDFWLARLKSLDSTLLADNNHRSSQVSGRQIKRVLLDIKLYTTDLYYLASSLEVGIETLLFAVHIRSLILLTNRLTVLTGLASHSRPDTSGGVEVLGLFLNTTPFKVNVDAKMSWAQLISAIQKEKAEIYFYRSYPLKSIHRLVENHELFDSLFNFINFHVFHSLKNLESIQISPGLHYEETNYTLVSQASIDPADNSLQYALIFNQGAVSEAKIAAISACFQQSLQALASAAKHEILVSPFLQSTPMNLPPKNWCINPSPYPTVPIQQLFAEQVLKNPNHIAISSGEISLTYHQLNQLTNQIANTLRADYQKFYNQPLASDTLIGLCIDQGLEAVIGMLAILKAGGAYVPLDPVSPIEKWRYLVTDSQIHWLVTQYHLANMQPALMEWGGARSLYLDLPQGWQTAEITDPNIINTGRDLAYVMYTSGSTGAPKGVMIEHHSISRLVKNTDFIRLTPQDRVAQAASIAFDASTFEIWGALLNGATLVCVSKDTLLDQPLFSEFLFTQKITVLWLTARLFDQFILNAHMDGFKNLTYLIVGGETLNKSTIKSLLDHPGGRPRYILNGYGPTENTTFTTVHHIDTESLQNASIPIGKVIANTEAYVLNEQCQPVPIGVPGELYIGGAGLARGYYNSPSLNDRLFMQTPAAVSKEFGVKEPSRLYKSGDLVRYLPDGNLEFLSRVDRQVKIRGYRVDLNEIENTIANLHGIKQCVVTVKNFDSGKKLFAYVVSSTPDLSVKLLKTELQTVLPDYAVPAFIEIMTSLPLTINGKIAYDQLPDPLIRAEDFTLNNSLVTAIEESLIRIWQSELPVKTINVYDNFFDLGGDSLLAMKLHTKLQLKFSKKISIVDIFRYPTIHSLAEYIQGNSQEIADSRTVEELKERQINFKKQQERFKRQRGQSIRV